MVGLSNYSLCFKERNSCCFQEEICPGSSFAALMCLITFKCIYRVIHVFRSISKKVKSLLMYISLFEVKFIVMKIDQFFNCLLVFGNECDRNCRKAPLIACDYCLVIVYKVLDGCVQIIRIILLITISKPLVQRQTE